MSTPTDSRCDSSASTSSSTSSSACTSSSNSDRLMQPRSSPRAISAATSGRELSSCATDLMLRRCRARCGKAVQRAPQKAGHVHLRHADLFGYLRLREVLLETQAEYQPFARGQCLQRAAQRLTYLDELVPVLVFVERFGERPALLLAAPRARRVERHGLVGGC